MHSRRPGLGKPKAQTLQKALFSEPPLLQQAWTTKCPAPTSGRSWQNAIWRGESPSLPLQTAALSMMNTHKAATAHLQVSSRLWVRSKGCSRPAQVSAGEGVLCMLLHSEGLLSAKACAIDNSHLQEQPFCMIYSIYGQGCRSLLFGLMSTFLRLVSVLSVAISTMPAIPRALLNYQ